MIAALIIGLVGSLHCVGMCGPIMITFVGPKQSKSTFLFYHVGRILSYLLIGAILGLLGASLQFLHIQKVLTIALGVALLAIYTVPAFKHTVEKWYFQSAIYRMVQGALALNLNQKRRWFISGMANGFLPCGLTYVAAAGAVALGDVAQGALFMVAFGLGTVPALAMVAISGSLITERFKRLIPQTVSVLAIVSGTIILLRGLLLTFPDFNTLVQNRAAALITICGV